MSRPEDGAPRAAAGGHAPHAPAARHAPGDDAPGAAEPVRDPAEPEAAPARGEPVVRPAGERPAPDPAPAGEGATTGAPEARGAARPDETEMARARDATAAGRMPGTTHDPNSVTTLTEAEPDGDVYPPPGTSERR